MLLRLFVAATALFASSLAAHAESVIYDFSFTGHWVDYVPTVASATGFGSLTITRGALVGDDLYLASATGLTLNTTVTVPGVGSSSYTYGTSDIDPNYYVGYWDQDANGQVHTSVDMGTYDVAGTNPALEDAAVFIIDNDGELNIDIDAADTINGGTKFYIQSPNTPGSVTPEPSSFLLLSTGMLGMAGVMRKRFA